MVREDMLWTKPGLPIAKQRGSRVLPSFFASVKCSITQASELRSEIGKVSGQKGKPTAAHLGRRSPLWQGLKTFQLVS